MYRRKAMKAIKAGMDPLSLSIRKWEDILYRSASDFGGKNCALCLTGSCENCIISYHTGLPECRGTPYEQWIHHHQIEHHNQFPVKIRCPKCVELVKQEIKFLKDLRLKWR